MSVLSVEQKGHVAVLTLNRPEQRNALNTPLLRALEGAVADAERSEDVAVIVLTGADPAFCGGVDLNELETEGRSPAMGDPLAGLSKPLIGAINGPAFTGGLELALMCDILVASERASFADTHARLGLLPGWGQMARLPHAVGTRYATEMLLTSAPVSADRALAVGLVNHVVAHHALMAQTLALADTIAAADGAAVREMLAQLRTSAGRPVAETLGVERERADAWQGDGFDPAQIAGERARLGTRKAG
jgi:enoyl-CoA hydratase